MRFSLLPFILPLALAAPLSSRTTAVSLAPKILDQISTLNSSLASLTSAVQAFDGTLLHVLPQSLAVITAETALDAATIKTTLTAKFSGNMTDAESTSVVQALAALITPIQASLTALTEKVRV